MNTRLIMTNVILIFVLVNFLDISRASRLAARQPQNSVFRYANNPQQSDRYQVDTDASTLTIQQKIDEVNRKHVLQSNRPMPIQWPYFSTRAHHTARSSDAPSNLPNNYYHYSSNNPVINALSSVTSRPNDPMVITRKVIYQQNFVPYTPLPYPYQGAAGVLDPNNMNQYLVRQGSQPDINQYFPVIIHNPFQMFMSALTGIVEYGPNANLEPNCKVPKALLRSASTSSSNTEPPAQLDIENLTIKGQGDADSFVHIEQVPIIDIDVAAPTNERYSTLRKPKNLPEVLLIAPESDSRMNNSEVEARHNKKVNGAVESIIRKTLNAGNVHLSKEQIRSSTTTTTTTATVPVVPVGKQQVLSPPQRDHMLAAVDDEPLGPDEEPDFEEEQKTDNVKIETSEGGSKKLVSKDNTGSGIFIHRLKVRKGGVAIAGPGGIATAGSGGTAIVGPNGYAFTKPDSLAIAGSGTKVIAVDPGFSLAQVVNATTGAGAVSPTRFGRLVAVGPVIYYNRG